METAYLGKCNITYGKGANFHVLYYIENSIKTAATQHELLHIYDLFTISIYFDILFCLTIFLLFLLI